MRTPSASVPRAAKGSRKRKMGVRVKWTDDMDKEIFDYCKSVLISGEGFEKPNAHDFYRKFLEGERSDSFAEVTLIKLVQHMKALKNSYHMALNWRNQTGQGILDADPTADEQIKRELIKRCKQFDEIDEILGDKPQFNPPYVHHSDFEPDFELLENDQEEVPEDPSAPDKHTESVDVTPIVEEDEENHEQPPPSTNEASSKDEEEKQPFKKRLRQSPIKSTVIALESAMKLRAESDDKRLAWESNCREQELAEKKESRMNQMTVETAKLDFEKKKWQDELELKTQSENRKYELEKLRIEKEAELQYQKMLQEFELEKMKIAMHNNK